MSTEPTTTDSAREGYRGQIVIPWEVPAEVIPDLDALVIEDGKPVDNIFMEKQERLLTEPLYSSWPGPGPNRPFQVFANVGLFYHYKDDPLVPDVMLVVDARTGTDVTKRENLSYFVWIVGKPPDVAIEMVSNSRGREEDFKLDEYARIGVPYYVIFDPQERLKHGVIRVFANQGGSYQPLSEPWFPRVGLGLTIWEGEFQGLRSRWLRWRDAQGMLIPTGLERADQEHQRADQERERRERLETQLRQLGIDPAS